MKYMLMMFGSAEEALQQPPEWFNAMIAFMIAIDVELRDTGEMVYNEGLADPSQATTLRMVDGTPVATDGPFAEAKESVIGFWVIDVASEERLRDITDRILEWSQVLEIRPVPDGPPDLL